MPDIAKLQNTWTEIPVGTRVQKIGHVEGKTRSWFGVVVRFVEPTGKGVEVEWGPNLSSWENASDLFLATSSAAIIETQAARIEELEQELDGLRKALIETGNAVGGGLADGVSSEFLAHVPEQARGYVAGLTRCVEAARPFLPGNAGYDAHAEHRLAEAFAAIRSRGRDGE